MRCPFAAGLDSSRQAPSESGASGHSRAQYKVFSLAETARLFHRDNKGSTAATIGNSTNFGGSDAGTGAACLYVGFCRLPSLQRMGFKFKSKCNPRASSETKVSLPLIGCPRQHD
jgi:hypothetical protein